jgi:2,3-bisphosphoglycerate-dependent phosphoglycerate mutase
MRILGFVMFLLCSATPALAQHTVFLIRHAEKQLDVPDPALTNEGRARATHWAALLAAAGIDAIYTSDALRTQQTGEIIAGELGLGTTVWPASDSAGLVDILQFDHLDDRVLIVGHTETLPGILQLLGVNETVSLSPAEFDYLFIVYGLDTGAPTLLHLLMP